MPLWMGTQRHSCGHPPEGHGARKMSDYRLRKEWGVRELRYCVKMSSE
jgi:hypothetical protein